MKKTISALITLILIATALSPAWAVPIGNDVEFIPAPRNLGINVIVPQAKLDVDGQVSIRGGGPATGKVLTSLDTSGLASWQTATVDNGSVGGVLQNSIVFSDSTGTKLRNGLLAVTDIPSLPASKITSGNFTGLTFNNSIINGDLTFNKNGSLLNPVFNGKVLFAKNSQTRVEPFTTNGGLNVNGIVLSNGLTSNDDIIANAPAKFVGDGSGLTNLNASQITSGTLPRSVISANDPWILVHVEDFETTPIGWSNNTTTSCAGHKILGGFNILSTTPVFKAFDLSGYPHSHVKLKFNYYSIDSWDYDKALAKIDGTIVWSSAILITHDYYRERSRKVFANCGSDAISGSFATNATFGKDEILTGEAIFDHSSSALRIEFASTLDELPVNESFGIDNLEIWLKEPSTQTLPLAPPASNNLLCGVAGQFMLPATEFNNLVGSRGNFNRGRNQVSIDWTRCDNQFVTNNTSNGGARISFINPPRPGALTLTINRTSVSAYGGLQLAWAANITWVGPRGTPTSANAASPFVFKCDFNGSAYTCTWL